MRREVCETRASYFPSFFVISLLVVTEPLVPYSCCHLVIALTRQHILTPSIFQVGGYVSERK